ncbi:hypothetical protein As57867_016945, partial [Aphanomyces stellatus]
MQIHTIISALLVGAAIVVVRADMPEGFEDMIKNLTASVDEEYGLNLTQVYTEQDGLDNAVEDLEIHEESFLDKPPVFVKATANGDLSFKILQIPDIHYTGFKYFPCVNPPNEKKWFCFEKYMSEMMDAMLDDVKPDFVVFSGDQVESLFWPQ